MVVRAFEREGRLNESQKKCEQYNQRTRSGGPHGKSPNNKGAQTKKNNGGGPKNEHKSIDSLFF